MAAQLSADHAPIIARAAAAMAAYRAWFLGPQSAPMPTTADEILSAYAGADERLYLHLAQAALDRAKEQGLDSREAGVWAKRRYGETPSASAAELSSDVRRAREIARAALMEDHHARAVDLRERVCAELGVSRTIDWFYRRVLTPVRQELGIRGAGKRAAVKGELGITATGATVARRGR